MPHPVTPVPTHWSTLQLPLSDDNRAEALAAFLADLRIPAAVRHSQSDGAGTLAVVMTDDDSIFCISDTFAPVTGWSRLSLDEALAAMTAEFGPGCTFAGAERARAVDDPATQTDPDSPPPTMRQIDAIAWTTHEKTAVISLLGARFGMAFDVVHAEKLGRAVRPHESTQTENAYLQGLWAMTDGVAVWRCGDEYSAAFVRRGQASIASWLAPWIRVDPTVPGQLVIDRSVSSMLEEVIAPDRDPDAWIAHFQLDGEHAIRLRALFRREAHAGVLDALFGILTFPRQCLDLLEGSVIEEEQLDIIEPRGAREQFADEMRASNSSAPHPVGFRHRRPRLWLVVASVGIALLTTLSIAGLASGRATAFLPGIAALVLTLSLVFDGAFGRALHAGSSKPAKDPVDSSSSAPPTLS